MGVISLSANHAIGGHLCHNAHHAPFISESSPVVDHLSQTSLVMLSEKEQRMVSGLKYWRVLRNMIVP
jgi:hypothetical protein